MAGTAGKPMSAGGSDDIPMSPETAELRADIERTREEMARTVSAIEERLSPAHLKEHVAELKQAVLGEYHEAKEHIKDDIVHELEDAKQALRSELEEVKGRIEGGLEEVKDRIEGGIDQAKTAAYDATVGKVTDMMYEARETVTEAGGSVLDTIRANPIPTALIAVGLGWLFLGTRSPNASSRQVIDRSGRALGRAAHVVGDTASNVGIRAREGAGDLAHRVQDTAGDIAHRVQDGATGLAHRVQDTAGDIAHSAGDLAHRVQDSATGLAHRVQDSATGLAHRVQDSAGHLASDARLAVRRVGQQAVRVEHTVESSYIASPLAFGAGAVVLGVAIGLALPSTSREDQWLGEVKDNLMTQAHDAAREALHGAEEKVDQVAALASTAQKSLHRVTSGMSQGGSGTSAGA